MTTFWVGAIFAAVAVLITLALIWRPLRARIRHNELIRARRSFHLQREHLEAKFLRLAGSRGKPRGLEWVRCDFDDDVIYARDRQSGRLSAFVGVTVGFEAIEGGGMEEVEAVGNLRVATAVFHVDGANWATEGRAIFNLNPTEAVAYFQENLELVGHELAHPN